MAWREKNFDGSSITAGSKNDSLGTVTLNLGPTSEAWPRGHTPTSIPTHGVLPVPSWKREPDKALSRRRRRDSCPYALTLANSDLCFLIRKARLVLGGRLRPRAWLRHPMPQAWSNALALPPCGSPQLPRAVPASVCGHARYLRSGRRRLPLLKTCPLGTSEPGCLLSAALSALWHNPDGSG